MSLLLSFTSFLTADVGSLPLLWVLVLALYLATFIIAFSGKSEMFGRPARAYYPILLVAVCIGLVPVFAKTAPTSAPMMAIYLIAYVAAALGCHSELARLKPDASRLTLFFLVVSFGGALGRRFQFAGRATDLHRHCRIPARPDPRRPADRRRRPVRQEQDFGPTPSPRWPRL